LPSFDWMIGVGLMFGLALVLNKYTFENLIGFLVFLTIFNAFVVWGGLLPAWSVIVNIVILVIMIYSETRNRGVN